MQHLPNKKLIVVLMCALCVIGPLMNCFFNLRACGGMHSPFYFVGYETGFGGRKLLGTIFNFILPEHVQHRHLIPFILGVIVLNITLFAIYVFKCLKNSKYKHVATVLLLAIYLVSPFSFLRMLSHLVWYADIWLYLATLIFLLLFTMVLPARQLL